MLNIDLSDIIEKLKEGSNYVYGINQCQEIKKKVNNLWVEGDPSMLAYYALKGIPVMNDISTHFQNEDGVFHELYVTPYVLIEFRKEYPEVTKEEFLKEVWNQWK